MTATQLPFDVNTEAVRVRFLEEEMPTLLVQLQPDTPAKWGQFTAQHMVEHLAWSMEMMAGILEYPCTTPEEKIPRYQTFLYNDIPIKPDFRSPIMGDKPPAYRCANLEAACKLVSRRWEDAKSHLTNSPDARPVNPVFGPLDYEQWHRFQYKHCFHHLSQFGLIEAIEKP